MWERSKATIFARVVVLEQAVIALLEDVLGAELRRQAQQEAYKLAESASSFGFAKGARLAREMESLFQGEAPPGQAETLRLSELVIALRRELEQPSSTQPELETLLGGRLLPQTKEEKCGRVLPVGQYPVLPQTIPSVDVVLIDDDEALSSLLLYALATCGYRTHWIKDGQAAVETLAGQQPSLITRVVLLDVGLPGLDGFSVLNRLAQDGVLQNTQVIMLTARATEAEELKAFELGAFDHVAKPFSLPVLLQRIRRALRG
jgi:CheY-like chemotaxis protein